MYQTDRLLLKVIGSEYSLEVLNYYKRNIEFLKPWEMERKEIFYTEKFQKIQLNKDFLDMKSGKLLRLWIFKKDNRGKLKSKDKIIGNIVFSNINLDKLMSCDLGYKLDKDEINQGYITEALTKAIDIMFNDYKFKKISVNIIETNKASLRVIEKLGFINREKHEEYINMVLVNTDMI